MSKGLPYDSDAGRNFAAVITALMTGEAYRQSAVLAKEMGPFKYWSKNRESFLDVIAKHQTAFGGVESQDNSQKILLEADSAWQEAARLGERYGFRNAQVTVLAPTGTIGFLMDCDTTGIEPDIALVKYKWLSEGGMIKIVNRTVKQALENLGYNNQEVEKILAHIEETDTIETAAGLKAEDLPVFDCAFKAKNGKRFIHYLGHIRMMAAVQPFLSGAISKTVNLPKEAAEEDIERAYMYAWEQKLKAIAVYRDGSKRTQPLTTDNADKKSVKDDKTDKIKNQIEPKPIRRRLADERQAITHKFSVAGHEGYLTIGLYEDGDPGEIFINMSKTGSVISGLMDSFAISISIALQYGVPLKDLVRKFAFSRFEPSGFTNNPKIQMARSIVDYVFRYLGFKFLSSEEQFLLGLSTNSSPDTTANGWENDSATAKQINKTDLNNTFTIQADAPPCQTCGSIMVRNGSCYKCLNCGATSGCS